MRWLDRTREASVADNAASEQLVCDNDVKSARIVKGRLEKTTLGQIVEEITQKLSPGICFVKVRGAQRTRPCSEVNAPPNALVLSARCITQVKLNAKTIEALQLTVTATSVATAILNTSKLKLKPHHVNVRSFTNSPLHFRELTPCAGHERERDPRAAARQRSAETGFHAADAEHRAAESHRSGHPLC